MKIHVRLAEPFWRSVGMRDLDLDFDPPATVGDLIDQLLTQYPRLDQEFKEVAPVIFIGEAEVRLDALLVQDATVYFVWPLSGG